jgi:Ca2+-binding RTX toxin-like protein
MAVGFATLGGGDTVSFSLDPNQISVVQAALHHLAAGPSDVSSVFGNTWQHPHDFNVYNLDGGATVPFTPPNTDAFVLDSVNGSAASSFFGSSSRAALWVGNQGNDTFIINAPSRTVTFDDKAQLGGLASDPDDADHRPAVVSDGRRDHDRGDHDDRGHDDDRGHPNDQDADKTVPSQTIIAGDGNNSIFFKSLQHSGANLIDVGNGNDTVTFLGNGTVHAGSGNNTIDFDGNGLVSVGGGNDTIIFAGNASIHADGAATVIGAIPPGGAHTHATVQGGSGNFVFTGNAGSDSVTAGSGAATLTAGSGNDTFHAGASSHALLDASAAHGNDALYGGSGNATLLGGSGHDSFFGGSGNTTMVGGSGWNFFTGGSGHDTMIAHTVPPGSGADPNVFHFDAATGGHHEIDGYNSTAPGGDHSIHLTFSNYGLTPAQIVTDSAIVGNDTVITIPSAGGHPTTTITIKDFAGIADWNIHSH